MPRNLFLALTLTGLLLSACDRNAPQPKPTPTAPRTDYLARINALTPQQRNATFYRAIEDAGYTCDTVADSPSRDAVEGRPAWDARCSDGRHWTLILFDDGVIQVLKAAPTSKDSGAAPTNMM